VEMITGDTDRWRWLEETEISGMVTGDTDQWIW